MAIDLNKELLNMSYVPRTTEWNYERDGYDPLEDFGPIGAYTGGATVEPIRNWFYKGQNTRIPNEAAASWRDLFKDDWLQRGKFGKGGTKGGWDLTRGFRPGVPASEGGFMSGPTPLGREAVLRTLGFLRDYVAPVAVGKELFHQGQEGSKLDQATEVMPDLQIGQFGINNNPETDIGKRTLDFLGSFF